MAPFCAAQTIEVESVFQPAPLSGLWKHHPGDDPRWADPAFDYSAWPSVRMPEAADQPTVGFSWYRFRVRLPETIAEDWREYLAGPAATSDVSEAVVRMPVGREGPHNRPTGWVRPAVAVSAGALPG